MSKILTENIKGSICAVNRLTYPESVNERLCNVISVGSVLGVIPVFVEKSRKDIKIGCDISNLVPFWHYYNGYMTKSAFLDFVYKIIQVIKSCEANVMRTENLDLYRDRIFINPENGEVRCIYWPVVNNQLEKLPGVFFQQLPSMFHFDPSEDKGYLDKYSSFFVGIEPFSVNNFERLILTLQGKSVVGDGGHFFGSANNRNGGYAVVQKKASSVEYDPFANYVSEENTKHCPACGAKNRNGAMYCDLCGIPLGDIVERKGETGGIKNIKYDHAEVFSEEAQPEIVQAIKEAQLKSSEREEKKKTAKLLSLRTGVEYTVGADGLKIGKDPNFCNVVITDNNYISRYHAQISEKDGRYYITDCKSTNKTYVENAMLTPCVSVELSNGANIRLASEEFTFIIE